MDIGAPLKAANQQDRVPILVSRLDGLNEDRVKRIIDDSLLLREWDGQAQPISMHVGRSLRKRTSFPATHFMSLPYLSWRVVLIGDPLYRPYKKKDQLKLPTP